MDEVIIFTMEGCPYCDELKEVLQEHKISYREKNVDENEEMYEKFSKAVNSEFLPAIIIGKRAFLPEQSFKTIKQAGKIVKNYLLEQSHRGNHLG